MQLRMWSYDLAREQAPTLDHLRDFLKMTESAGYNALGLYMEHRFAYPSTPWAHGKGCVTPEMIADLRAEFPNTPIIPFVNLLGHFEGMIYTEFGKRYREATFQGMQACPCNPEFIQLCERLVDETIEIFGSEIIHIGGDETWQLGQCPICKAKVEREDALGKDGKAQLYGSHFGPLAHRVLQKGRRPAVWGDMFLDHPDALNFLPKETLIFDWQYFGDCTESCRKFKEKGFDVVCCPSIHVYNSVWCHLPQSEQNVGDAVASVGEVGAYGVCVTTWESGLFGNYGTILPAIKAAGEMLGNAPQPAFVAPGETDDPSDIDDWTKLIKEDAISLKPTAQMPGTSREEVHSLAYGVCINILLNAVKGKVGVIQIEPSEERANIYFDGQQAAYLPNEQFRYSLQKLKLYSNIDPLKINGVQKGLITLIVRDKEFVFESEIDLDAKPSILKMTRIGRHGTLQSPEQSDYFSLTDAPKMLAEYAEEGDQDAAWARLMGVELPKIGGVFGFSKTRSSLKVRLLLNANPFLCWMHHHEELCGPKGDEALALLEKAIHVAPNTSMRGVSEFVKLAIDFVRFAEQARQAYAQGLPGVAVASLAPCRQIFEHLQKTAVAANINWGGSLADIERCKAAHEHVERVMKRIRNYGDGSLGYLPAFEHLTHPKFMPHDQAAWWLINRWANE